MDVWPACVVENGAVAEDSGVVTMVDEATSSTSSSSWPLAEGKEQRPPSKDRLNQYPFPASWSLNNSPKSLNVLNCRNGCTSFTFWPVWTALGGSSVLLPLSSSFLCQPQPAARQYLQQPFLLSLSPPFSSLSAYIQSTSLSLPVVVWVSLTSSVGASFTCISLLTWIFFQWTNVCWTPLDP